MEELLESAIVDEIRIKHELGVVFVTEQKHPAFRKWQLHAHGSQTNKEIRNLYKKRGKKNTGYSYYTGVGGLIDIDFDWEWTYHVAMRHFGERMNTRTIKTPNGGYRVLFIVDEPHDFLKFKEKPPKVEIHGNKGHHVLVYGKVKNDQGELKEYELVKDLDIRKDNKILPDLERFLTEINLKCEFLEYGCINECLKHKKNNLTHEQRTAIGAFFAAEKIDINTAKDFFRTCYDFEEKTTEYHLEQLYEKEFVHPTCENLINNFRWDVSKCNHCKRKTGDFLHDKDPCKQKERRVEDPFDLTKIDLEEIFQNRSNESISSPIFEFNGELFFAMPLEPIKPKPKENIEDSLESHKDIIGYFGLDTGYGYDTVDSSVKRECADLISLLNDVPIPHNKDQARTIRYCIKESIKSSHCLIKSRNIFKTVVTDFDIGKTQDDINERLQYYMKLDERIQYNIVTSWVIGTYMFPLFSTYGYLIISGEKGAGKGTFLDLMSKLCWNSSNKLISPSESTLFRVISSQKPTLIIDEYHRLVKSGVGNAIESILESGYEKGGAVSRTSTVKIKDETKHVVDLYDVYCPKILATRTPVEADDKGIKFIITKLFGDSTYARRKTEINIDPFFDSVRNDLLKWVIKNQQLVTAQYNSIEPTRQLNGRDFNVWLPILAIAKVAFPDEYEEILRYAEKSVSVKRSNEYEKENKVLTALNELLPILTDGGKKVKEPSYRVTNKDIQDMLLDIEDEKMNHQTIRSALDNLKLTSYRNKGTYYIKKQKLKNLLSARGYKSQRNERYEEPPIEKK